MSAHFLRGWSLGALSAVVALAWVVPAGAAPIVNPGTWSIYSSAGDPYSSGYTADKMIDGDLDTLAVLNDATPPNVPVTGHMVFNLGQPMLISALELVSRNHGNAYNPKDVRFFYFTDDNPANKTVVDDIENDAGIVAMHVGNSTEYTFSALTNGASQVAAFNSPIVKQYLGMRVDDAYITSLHNFQIAQIKLEVADLPLSTATAVWHFSDLSDSAGSQTLNPPAGTGAVDVPAATPIAARNSNNRVFDAGGGGKTTTTDHGWIGIHPYPGTRPDELTPRLNTSLSVFARVRWTDQFNWQPQPLGTDDGVDDILRFGHTSHTDQDWYALQLYAGDENTTEGQAQFVMTGKGAVGSETTLRHDSMLSLDTWYDITGVFNSDEQTATIYVFDPQTGREFGTSKTIDVGFSSLEDAGGNLLMMVSPNFGEGPNPFAQMDLAAVWHTALTPAQVAYLSYVPEPGTAAMLLIAVGVLLLRRRIV